jgi:hypothetical protein
MRPARSRIDPLVARRVTVTLGKAIALWALTGCGAAADRMPGGHEQPVAQEATLAADYPRTMGFRVLEAPDETDEQLRRFDVIHAKTAAARARHPTALAIEHWNMGKATRPGEPGWKWTDLAQPTFAGHWLLFNGAELTQNLAADPGATVLHVSKTEVFSVDNFFKFQFGPDDLMIYALDAEGKPDWSTFEHAVLEAIDPQQKTITVKRAQYDSQATAFAAGRARVATHAVYEPTFSGGPYRFWWVNFSPFGPRDAQGRSGAERAGDSFAAALVAADVDGVEFDVGWWACGGQTLSNVPTANAHRGVDIDNDGSRDDGMVDVPGVGPVDACGLGSVDFTRQLRDGVGPNLIIQSEGRWRGWPWANGVEIEGFPDFERDRFWRGSPRMEHYRFAAARSGSSPKMSYLQMKTPTDAWHLPGVPLAEYQNRDRLFRWAFAGAMMGDGLIAYTMGEGAFGHFTWWDEYWRGLDHARHYLGQPISSGQFVAGLADGPDRLHGAPTLEHNSQYAATLTPLSSGHRVTITQRPSGPVPWGLKLTWAIENFDPSKTYTLRGRVRASAGYATIDPEYAKIARRVDVKIGGRKAVLFYADGTWWDLVLPLAPDPAQDAPRPEISLWLGEEPGWVEVEDLTLSEGGLVLMNGAEAAVTFDLAAIDPGRRHRRLTGEISSLVNDGTPVFGKLTVGPYDGLTLLAEVALPNDGGPDSAQPDADPVDGTLPDAGTIADAANDGTMDAGGRDAAPSDAGMTDGLPPLDSFATDDAQPAKPDAPPADDVRANVPGRVLEGNSGCNASPRPVGAPTALLLILVMVGVARRRRAAVRRPSSRPGCFRWG